MELIIGAILAGLVSLTNADVGFSDSKAYLKTEISPDNTSLRFSLSEKSVALEYIDLKSEKYFEKSRLEDLILNAQLHPEIKKKLYDMLWGSLMSGQKSSDFLEALAGILQQYESQEKFEL